MGPKVELRADVVKKSLPFDRQKLDAVVSRRHLVREATHPEVEQLPGEKGLPRDDVSGRQKPGRDEG